jgi:hypothetical protein
MDLTTILETLPRTQLVKVGQSLGWDCSKWSTVTLITNLKTADPTVVKQVLAQRSEEYPSERRKTAIVKLGFLMGTLSDDQLDELLMWIKMNCS